MIDIVFSNLLKNMINYWEIHTLSMSEPKLDRL